MPLGVTKEMIWPSTRQMADFSMLDSYTGEGLKTLPAT